MKSFKSIAEEIHPFAKILLKCGTVFATVLLLLAFFSETYGIDMCTMSVYLFAQSIISSLLMDVFDKRRRG
ncbi:MAG: hypothetical protein E7407_01685 [Ruminococcaceae bacterium]|nr:hypothetical protein [Oscillospiraceae bacterium]